MPGASSSNGRRYGRGRWERSIIIVIAPAAHGPARWTGARQASRGRGAIDCELEGVKAADQDSDSNPSRHTEGAMEFLNGRPVRPAEPERLRLEVESLDGHRGRQR
jgi:hypothetical protein